MSIDAPKSNKADINIPPRNISTPSGTPTETTSGIKSSPHPAISLTSINIKVDQAVQAKVVEVLNAVTNKATQHNFNVTLDIAGTKLLVKTNIQLQPGQLIEVRANSKGELLLPPPTTKEISPLIQAISRVLPFQQPVGKTVASILQNLPMLEAQNPQLKTLADNLTQLLPKATHFKPVVTIAPDQTTPQPNYNNIGKSNLYSPGMQIRQALENSGIFMENRLAATSYTAAITTQAKNLSPLINSRPVESTPTSTATPLPPGNPGSMTAPPGTSDLKAVISQMINTLSTMSVSGQTAAEPITKVLAASDPTLLINPFNFPTVAGPTKGAGSDQERNLSVGDLLKRLAGALNRIQFNQLNSLYQAQTSSSDTATIQTWHMEIPFLTAQNDIDPIQVRIDQQTSKNKNSQDPENQSSWKLSLAFDLDNLGPLYIQVNLSPPNVSSTIWAEQQQTLKLINREANNFRESLIKLGLTVDDICCRQGQPNTRKARLEQQIVDIKA